MVINTDPHTKPGMHWIAIYVDSSGHGLFFDSYGNPPFVPDHINRLRKNCKTFRWNSLQLQSPLSDVCGQFCIMFLQYMSNGLGFEKFISNFSDDLKKNDAIARNFVRSRHVTDTFVGSGGCAVRCLQNCASKMSLL